MADATLQIDIVADDQASAVIQRVTASASSLGAAANSAAQSANRVTSAGDKLEKFGNNLDKATKPLQAAALGIAAAGTASAKVAIDFENNFAKVKKTVEGTPEQLEAVRQGIINLTTVGINGRSALPATTEELTEIAAMGGQLGIATDNIVEFTEVMAQMGSATNLSGEDGAATLARLMNVTNTDQSLIRNMGSAIVDLGNNFATTENEIARMAMRMGATGTIVGMSVQDILAYSTALSSLGIEAEAGGSAFSRILMSISTAVSEGGSDLEAFAKTSGMSAKSFAAAWKDDASGAFKSFIEGLSKSDDIIGKLEELGFKNIRDVTGLQNLSGARGIELITEALERSNRAWEENTALQTEADAMAKTTAGQLTITKNNITEAARSMGEVLMPTIADWSGKVRDTAQGLANMSDEQKQSVVSTAATVTGLGLLAKGASSAAKTVSAMGKAIGTLGPYGTAAVVGIGAVTAAVVKGVSAYKQYQYEQLHWADGLDELTSNAKSAADKLETINGLQREMTDLRVMINAEDSTEETVAAAKARIEEIAKLLEEKYNLKITTDDSNLDGTIDKLDTAIAKYKEMSASELKLNANNLYNDLLDNKEDYDNADKVIAEQTRNYDECIEKANQYSGALAKAKVMYSELKQEEQLGISTESELSAGYEKLFNFMYDNGMAQLFMSPASLRANGQNFFDNVEGWIDGYTEKAQEAQSVIDATTEAVQKQEAGINDLVNQWVALYSTDPGYAIDKLKSAIDNLGVPAEDVALKLSLMQNGFDSLDSANAANALQAVVDTANQLNDTYGLKEGFKLELTADGTVVWVSDTSEPDGYENSEHMASGTVVYGKNTNEPDSYKPEDKYATVHYTLSVETRMTNVLPNYNPVSPSFTSNAKGTQNFGGGLAMVNDQTGISDPRELIVDKGRAFIPQGKNVILPLSRGAKVYTAAQTKAIMASLGIPMYASGKDNSEEFTTAVDNLNHRKRTSSMSVAAELQEWIELSKQFTENINDVMEIEEQIYSLTCKQTDELNKQSEAYIEERSALYDWEENGDTQLAAFYRIRDRNLAELEAGRQTYDEYVDIVTSAGKTVTESRMSQSLKWIEHQKKYNDMSVEDEMAAYQRIQAYLLEYYEQGLIDLQEYNERATEINEKYLDTNEKRLENIYSSWQKSMNNWINIRNTYDDWDEYGDSLSQTYARALVRIDELYENDVISWQEKEDAKLEYSLEMYKAASDEYDDILAEQQDRINKVKEEYSTAKSELQTSWDVADREEDLDEVNALLKIYKNAATDAGQQKYKELLEQKEKLERDEELYELEVEENETISKLEEEYTRMEENKKNVLASLKIAGKDTAAATAYIADEAENVRDIAHDLSIRYATASETTVDTLFDIYGLLTKIAKRMGSSSTYNNNSTVNISGGVSESYISRIINGTVVSGLGSVM